MKYQPVIGLEIHVQLKTASKIFSGASTSFGNEPNTQACAIDLGLPGVGSTFSAPRPGCTGPPPGAHQTAPSSTLPSPTRPSGIPSAPQSGPHRILADSPQGLAQQNRSASLQSRPSLGTWPMLRTATVLGPRGISNTALIGRISPSSEYTRAWNCFRKGDGRWQSRAAPYRVARCLPWSLYST